MVVYADGGVSVCCYDVNGELKIGNAMEQNLKEIWNSQAIERLRNMLLNGGASNIKMCKGCDMARFYAADLRNPQTWKKLMKKVVRSHCIQ